MTEPSFDPSALVLFDLEHGLVHVEGAPAHALVPVGALTALFRSAPEAERRRFAQGIGAAIGERAAARFGGTAALAAGSPEAVLAHLAGEIGTAGLGAMGLERWGRALVAVVDGDAALDALLEDAIGSAVSAATGSIAVAAPLGREGSRVRFLLTSPATAARIATLGASGWVDVLARLHDDADTGGTP